MPIIALCFASCGASSKIEAESNNFENASEACNEYLRAFTEEENLDPFGQAVVRALDIPGLTSLNSKMTNEIEQIEIVYPGAINEYLATLDFSSVELKFGSAAVQALRDYSQTFMQVDKQIRESCNSLGSNSSTSIP